jgi:hypothetical protein
MKSKARSEPLWIGQALGARYQGDLLQGVAEIRHLGWNRVALSLERERLPFEGLEQDIDAFPRTVRGSLPPDGVARSRTRTPQSPCTELSRCPSRSSRVKGKALLIARWIGRGTFKAAALIGAFLLIVAAWLWDASLLTTAADENLRLIKAITRLLPLDWPSKVESALRIFGADRALLLIEGVALAKLIMLAVALPFRRRP